MAEGYRTFDHTGDLGLEVWADTPERLFALAAEALIAQIARTDSERIEVTRRLQLTGDDRADLLVHWLNTVLLEFELQRVVWTRVSVDRLDARSIDAVIEGPRLRLDQDVRFREVKAVSHHHLELALEPPSCRCRMVLDI